MAAGTKRAGFCNLNRDPEKFPPARVLTEVIKAPGQCYLRRVAHSEEGLAELLKAYKDSVDNYRAAVDAMVFGRAQGKSIAERRRLEGDVDAARLNCEERHFALAEYQLERTR
jgi:hypothetical protein